MKAAIGVAWAVTLDSVSNLAQEDSQTLTRPKAQGGVGIETRKGKEGIEYAGLEDTFWT